ncbi:MAG: winged helix DNA-binding protein [Thaumarchaeota archaeon]|nr:winged helix DNA-binding protein [Nitrososphaerota archaeon]
MSTIIADGQRDDGARLTQVLRRTNITYRRMTEIVDKLLRSGLILEAHTRNGRKYHITDRGIEYVMEYNKFKDYASAFGLKI